MSIDPKFPHVGGATLEARATRSQSPTQALALPTDLVTELQRVADELGMSLEEMVIGELCEAFGVRIDGGE